MYVAYVEQWSDDDKRPEGSSAVVGCFSTEAEARKAALRAEIIGNIAQSDEGQEFTDEYAAFLEEPQITKKIFDKAAEVREQFLGEAMFTMLSSGYRASVTECTVDDEARFYSGYWLQQKEAFQQIMEERQKQQAKSSKTATTQKNNKKQKKV